MEYQELKNYILKECYRIAVKYFEQPQVILYGSRAREDWTEDSDWDILVIPRREVSKSSIKLFKAEIYDLSLQIDQIITTIVNSYDEWYLSINKATPFFENIQRDGYIYDSR